MKNKNGITLIALVITIIVLLILAGVSVVTLTGENGLLTKVQTAKTETTKAEARERVELELAEWGIVKNTQPDAMLVDFLSEKFGAENVTSNTDGGYIVTVDEYKVDVDANGKVTGIVINETAESIPEVITNYTAEEIDASEYLYAIGKTAPTNVVAKFNEDYTQVTITKNGEDSDGVMTGFAPWESMFYSPMQNKKDTLETAIIKKGVVNIGEGGAGGGAFSGCTKLKNITIPTSVTSIGQAAFNLCTSLTNIEIPRSVYTISGSAFSNCISLIDIEIPSSVTSIGQSAFNECTSLTKIEIPSSVYTIDGSAFSNCTSLINIEIPSSVTTIGDHAFYNCTSLINIEIPSSVTRIASSTFRNCTSLTNIEIPSSVNIIMSAAFKDCTNLTKVKIIPISLYVDEGSFNNLAPNAKIYVLNEEVKSALEGDYDGTTTVEVVTEEQMKQL